MSQYCIPEKLPRKIHRTMAEQVTFGGLAGHPGATGDKILAMKQMSPHRYPSMAVRKGFTRYVDLVDEGEPYGMLYHEGLYVVYGHYLYRMEENGQLKSLAYLAKTGPKQMVAFQDKIYIFPDKMVYDPAEDSCRSLEMRMTLGADAIWNQEIVTCESINFVGRGLRAGDGITITIENTLTGIKEISHYKLMMVEEHQMVLDRAPTTKSFSCVIDRSAPALEKVCVMDDRMWGFCGQTVYACAKGNGQQWYNTREEQEHCGEWAEREDAPVMMLSCSEGDFTAVAPWQNYLVFFKEDSLCKLLGEVAGSYYLSEWQAPGVMQGGTDTLCQVGDALYYLSAQGVFTYDGGYPRKLPQIPDARWVGGVGGSDGAWYYLCGHNEQGESELYVYDATGKCWYDVDACSILCMTRIKNTLYMLTEQGELLQTGGPWGKDTIIKDQAETSIALQASVEFCDDVRCILEGQRLHKLYLFCHGEDESFMRIKIAYDGEQTYREIGTCSGRIEGWVEILVPPVRCKYYRLRLEMTGPWCIDALHRVYEKGQQM